jgi:hypothetical protein
MSDNKDTVGKLRAGTLLVVAFAEVAILGLLLLAWHFEWFSIDELPEEIGGVLPLIVPWGGALGGVAISLVGLAQYWRNWYTKEEEGSEWNAWYLIRPVLGAILGSIGALILVLLLGSLGTTDEGGVDTSPQGAAILMLIAFIIGYRQQTFATLISRAVDVVLGPGEATPTTGYTIEPTSLEFTTSPGAPASQSVTLTNEGSGLLRTPHAAFKITGADASLFKVSRFPGNVAAGADATIEVTYLPPATGDHNATLDIQLSSAARSVALHGTST